MRRQSDVRVVNFPSIPHDHLNPDKYRLPLGTDELPVDLGPAGRLLAFTRPGRPGRRLR